MSESDGPERRDATVTAVLCPGDDETASGACLAHVDGRSPDSRVLAVTTSNSADAFVDEWFAHRGRMPGDLVVCELAQPMRSAGVQSPAGGSDDVRPVAVAGADSEGTDAVTTLVDGLADEWSDAGGRPVVYVDSLSELVYDAGLSRTVEWLDALGDELAANGWRGAVRIDDGRHDPRTLRLLESAVDLVLELDGDRSWTTRDGLVDDETKATRTGDHDVADVFDSLQSERRRHVLWKLGRSNRPLTVAELADHVVEHTTDGDREPTDAERSRVYTGLYHVHLPKLDEMGLVSYDRAEDIVSLEPPAREAEPLLLLSTARESHD